MIHTYYSHRSNVSSSRYPPWLTVLGWLAKYVVFCTIQFASQGCYCMLVCSFCCFLKTSSFLSLTKYVLYQHVHTMKSHLICFWNMVSIICTCFECQANVVIVRMCNYMWKHTEIKEDCCYLAEWVFKHSKEGSWHQKPKQWTCALQSAHRNRFVCAAEKTDVNICALLTPHPWLVKRMSDMYWTRREHIFLCSWFFSPRRQVFFPHYMGNKI